MFSSQGDLVAGCCERSGDAYLDQTQGRTNSSGHSSAALSAGQPEVLLFAKLTDAQDAPRPKGTLWSLEPRGDPSGRWTTYERHGRIHHVRRLVPGEPADGSSAITLGYLYLSHPTTEIDQQVLGYILSSFLTGLVLLLLVGVPATWHLYGVVIRPIARLISANRAAAEGRDDEAFVPTAEIPTDEIGLVMASWNRLHSQVLDVRETLRERNRELADRNRLLEERNVELNDRSAELSSWSAELENRILEKSAELFDLQERAHRSERLAAVGQLAAGVAHEIRNPLASIAGYAEDIRELIDGVDFQQSPVSEEIENALKIIEEQAYRCKQITKKLLDFGRTDYSMAPLDISELVLETLAVVTHKAKRRGITLRDELSENLPLVVTDRAHLQQVIMNLLDNAIDAVPEQSGHVTIRTMPVIPGSRDRVAISVSDDGHGISAEDQGRIFDPFFTTKSKGAGTGLGLAIARSVIRRLGGRLELESVPERGSIFRIELPVEESGATTNTTGARGATPATTTP